MNIQEIIDQGNKIQFETLPWSTGYTFLTIALCLVLVVSFIGISYSLLKLKGNINTFLLSVSILMFITVTAITVDEINEVKREVFNEQVDEWRTEVAREYIETLPITKKEITIVNVQSENLDKYTRNWWSIDYTDYENQLMNYVEFSYEEGGETVKVEGFYEVAMDLEDHEKPYIEYQLLEEDLGHGVREGFYNIVVHVPEK